MKIKIVERGDHRFSFVRLDAGEVVVTSLVDILRERGIGSGRLTGRGRLQRLTVVKPPGGDAVSVPCPADVLLLEGDVVREGDGSGVVLNALVVLPDGSVSGGRVAEAVAEALEITLEVSPLLPARRVDPATGAPFADLAAGSAGDPRSAGESVPGGADVDEAAAESFPASDPPSFAGVPEDRGA